MPGGRGRRPCRSTSARRRRGASPPGRRALEDEELPERVGLRRLDELAERPEVERLRAEQLEEARVVRRGGRVEAVRPLGIVRVRVVGARDEADAARAGAARDRLAEPDVRRRADGRARARRRRRARRARSATAPPCPSRAAAPPRPGRCRRTRRRRPAALPRGSPRRGRPRARGRSRAPRRGPPSRRRSGPRRARCAASRRRPPRTCSPRSGGRARPSRRAAPAPHRRRRAARSRRSRSRQRGDPLDEQLEEPVRVDVDARAAVARPVGDVPAVDDRAAVAPLRRRLDLDVALDASSRASGRSPPRRRARRGSASRRSA